MSEKKKPFLLPRLEIAIMGLFFLIFTFWAVNRCNATKEEYRRQALLEEQARAEEAAAARSPAQNIDSLETEEPPSRSSSTQRITPLYVTMDGLNLRTEPTLASPVILKLELYEEVYFLNEVTPFKDSISLGDEVAYEPWIKVRHRKGRSGWVYGAGVHYYKIKR